LLNDGGIEARCLLRLSLLIVAELVVHQRLRLLVPQFVERDLIPKGALPQMDAAIAAAFRLRNSMVAEVIIVAVVYVVGILVVWRHYAAIETGTWDAAASAGGARPARAAHLWQ